MRSLPIRTDQSPDDLRTLARAERRVRVCRRLLAIANALEDQSRGDAAKRAGMERQALRDMVIRYNAEGVSGLADRPRSGRPPKLSEGQLAALKSVVLRGPDADREGLSRYRAIDLCDLVADRYGVHYSEGGMQGLLRSLGLSWQKPRPRHPQSDPKAQERFKKRNLRGSSTR